MARANVLNRFEQPTGGSDDNPLILEGTVETGSGQNVKTRFVTLAIGDLSTAVSAFVVPGFAGTITKITCVINAGFSTPDAKVEFFIGGQELTDADIVIPFADAVFGFVVSSSPTALNIITATDSIQSNTTAQAGSSSTAVITFEIEVS